MITLKDVEHVAKLARLALGDKELDNLTSQLDKILQHVEKLKELDTSGVAPCAHPFFTKTVWREDVARPIKNPRAIVQNAPESEDEFFKVNKVIE